MYLGFPVVIFPARCIDVSEIGLHTDPLGFQVLHDGLGFAGQGIAVFLRALGVADGDDDDLHTGHPRRQHQTLQRSSRMM